jgi:TetR/AcrR family transcriptional repressor of nem operon
VTSRPPRSSRQRLLDIGLAKLLERGYHGLGIQEVLDAAHAPKGSFYHHFVDKEDFALQVVDQYMEGVHAALDACLADESRPPLERVRQFFELTRESYRREGYMGCLLGGLGQELSCASPVFRRRIESCIATIAGRLSTGLEEARLRGDLAADTDTTHLAGLLVNCWEGAALRSRLQGDPQSLVAMLDFFFSSCSNASRERGVVSRECTRQS